MSQYAKNTKHNNNQEGIGLQPRLETKNGGTVLVSRHSSGVSNLNKKQRITTALVSQQSKNTKHDNIQKTQSITTSGVTAFRKHKA